jgi:hypothetical protein
MTELDVVARFLAQQPEALARDAMTRRLGAEPDAMQAWGAAWRALCDAIGIACPPALVRLGDAMHEHFVYFSFEKHSYQMLTPAEAADERALLAKFAGEVAALVPYTAMLPVFGEDGDLLLLDQGGAVHALAHDDWEHGVRVATDLEDLLARTRAAALNLGAR